MTAPARAFVCGTRKVVTRPARSTYDLELLTAAERDARKYSDGVVARYRKVPQVTYHVVCATCDGGGRRPYGTQHEANQAAIAQSNRRCTVRHCGAS